MKLWREIVSTAIVGTERQKFELSARGGAGELDRILHSLKFDDNETGLLKTAAVISVYLKNGIDSLPDKEDLSSPSPEESRDLISVQSEQHLATMLSGNYRAVLPEFLELAAKRDRVLPPQLLPEILDSGNSNRDLRRVFLPVLGERGRWLARHNYDWRWALIEENAAEVWETGRRDERLFAMEALRRRDSAEALEFLSRDWQSESAKDRAAFLEVLKINLSKSDESFLDKVLQTDKSSEVRRNAFNLLLKIPDSNSVKNITERALALLSFKPGGFFSKPKIEINFPGNFEAETKDDVLKNLELYPDERELGKKAVRLVKLLHCVPPKVWEEKFSTGKEIIIEAAKQNEWQKALLNGFKSAAVNFVDEEWLISVLPENGQNDYYLLCNQIEREWSNLQIEKLIAVLLEGRMKSGFGFNFAAQLFYRLKAVWSDDFARKVLNFLLKPATEKDLKALDGLIIGILNSARFVSADYLKRFEEKPVLRLFEKIGQLHDEARLVEEFIAVAQFRREMRAAFQNKE